MTSSTIRLNQHNHNKLASVTAQPSTSLASTRQKPARSFVAILLGALSAFAA